MSSAYLPPKLTTVTSRKGEKANSIWKPLYHLDSPHAGPQVSQLDHITQATQHQVLRKSCGDSKNSLSTAGGQVESAFLNSGMEAGSKRRLIHISGSPGVPTPGETGSGG